jgi:hypothetical protein
MNDLILKNIEKELGLENLPEQEKNEILLRISTIIYQGVMLKIVDILSEEDQETLNDFFKNEGGQDQGDKILTFLKSKIENLDDIVLEEVERFKKESTESMSAIKNNF